MSEMTTQETNIIGFTEKAIQKVKDFAVANPEAEGKMLRVYVESGGCSGFQYGFAFDERRDDDNLVDLGEIKALVDPQSAVYLKGAQVDYLEDFRGSGFSVTNPNAKSKCGCGESFGA